MAVIEQVGFAPFAQKLPAQLWGWMDQHLGLARALAVNPSLTIMDETFSALDTLKRREMQNVLFDRQRERQRTIWRKRCALVRGSRSSTVTRWCRSVRRRKSPRPPPMTTHERSSKESTPAVT